MITVKSTPKMMELDFGEYHADRNFENISMKTNSIRRESMELPSRKRLYGWIAYKFFPKTIKDIL